ncbi:hypothetical protein BDC45DRAFT_538905 [Circinella umbellata]|nr:hypothetical protein BDC45DRAFT_538905 [Circinella umbellata]
MFHNHFRKRNSASNDWQGPFFHVGVWRGVLLIGGVYFVIGKSHHMKQNKNHVLSHCKLVLSHCGLAIREGYKQQLEKVQSETLQVFFFKLFTSRNSFKDGVSRHVQESESIRLGGADENNYAKQRAYR